MTEIKTGSLLPQTLIKHHLLQIPHDLRATHLDNHALKMVPQPAGGTVCDPGHQFPIFSQH